MELNKKKKTKSWLTMLLNESNRYKKLEKLNQKEKKKNKKKIGNK